MPENVTLNNSAAELEQEVASRIHALRVDMGYTQ